MRANLRGESFTALTALIVLVGAVGAVGAPPARVLPLTADQHEGPGTKIKNEGVEHRLKAGFPGRHAIHAGAGHPLDR